MKILKRFIVIVFCLILLLVSIWPLFEEGYFPMHDDTQTARVYAMAVSISDGMFPVRWVSDLGYGYGYPIFNFYAPFAYYVGAVFYLLGIALIPSTKIMFGIGMVSAFFSMYFLARAVWGRLGGVVSGALYLLAPYHALNLYVRGAIGELFAYGFLPLPFLGLWGLYQSGKYRYGIVAALGLALIILSHNLTAMMISPVLIIFTLILSMSAWRKRKTERAIVMIISLGVGLLLSTFYVIPALFELSYTHVSSILGGGSNPVDHFVCWIQFWQGQWGFGGSVPGCLDGMSFILGKIHILMMLVGVIALVIFFKKKKMKETFLLTGLFSLFGLSIFLMIPSSRFIWQSLPLMDYFQFPWRFLTLSSFSSSLIAGGVIGSLIFISQRKSLWISIGVASAVIILSSLLYGKYFKPQYLLSETKQLTESSYFHWPISKVSDEYLPVHFDTPDKASDVPQKFIVVESGKAVVDEEVIRTQIKKVKINAEEQSVITVNLAAFPAWKFRLDDSELNPTVKRGVYTFKIPRGNHTFTAQFVSTPLEKSANALSLIGFAILVAGIIRGRKKALL